MLDISAGATSSDDSQTRYEAAIGPHWSCIADIRDKHNLIVLNNGEGTRLDSKSGNLSHTDLTFASPNIVGKSNWSSIDDFCGSDHIKINIGSDLSSEIFAPKWNFSKADWNKFKHLCDICCKQLDFSKDINSLNEDLLFAIS